MKKDVITWTPKKVLKKNIVATPDNYKIKTELGMKRFEKSKELFGLAGTVIANIMPGGKVMLIDGNTRTETSTEKWLWVSLPSRKLTPKEFEEMSMMYDYSAAGDVDIKRISDNHGTTVDFYEKWNMPIPMELLNTLGNKGIKGNKQAQEDLSEGKKSGVDAKKKQDENFMMTIQLIYTPAEEKLFRSMEEKLGVRFKTESIHQTVLKAFKTLLK